MQYTNDSEEEMNRKGLDGCIQLYNFETSTQFWKIYRKVVLLWQRFREKFNEAYDSWHVWIGAYLYNWTEEDTVLLLQWVHSKVPGYSLSDFSYSWKNGLTLVALLEGIVPNTCTCTQYHLLDPKHPTQNVELAFSMAKKYLGVKPTLTPQEVAAGNTITERKLIRFVIMLKLALARRQDEFFESSSRIQQPTNEDPVFRNQPCLAKGVGLMAARRNHPARFNIYVKRSDQMDIIVEIRGPHRDFSSRRITNRSPRQQKKASITITNVDDTSCDDSSIVMNIPMEYEIVGRKISITYHPVSVGEHQLYIYWRGRHLEESPYTVMVYDSSECIPKQQKQQLPPKRQIFPLRNEEMNKKAGRVISRKVLRQVVLRNGKEIELQEHEPLPFDPMAWCGNSSQEYELACQMKTVTDAENHQSSPDKDKENEQLQTPVQMFSQNYDGNRDDINKDDDDSSEEHVAQEDKYRESWLEIETSRQTERERECLLQCCLSVSFEDLLQDFSATTSTSSSDSDDTHEHSWTTTTTSDSYSPAFDGTFEKNSVPATPAESATIIHKRSFDIDKFLQNDNDHDLSPLKDDQENCPCPSSDLVEGERSPCVSSRPLNSSLSLVKKRVEQWEKAISQQ